MLKVILFCMLTIALNYAYVGDLSRVTEIFRTDCGKREVPGCSMNCNSKCHNFHHGPSSCGDFVQCTTPTGCDCDVGAGYYFHEIKKKCVPSYQCPYKPKRIIITTRKRYTVEDTSPNYTPRRRRTYALGWMDYLKN